MRALLICDRNSIATKEEEFQAGLVEVVSGRLHFASLVGERSEPLSRVFNDQPRGIYIIIWEIRTYVCFYYACACTHERLLLHRNVS